MSVSGATKVDAPDISGMVSDEPEPNPADGKPTKPINVQAAIDKAPDEPQEAQITEPSRFEVGRDLAKMILIIVAGAIGVLVAYLAVLDVFTSTEVGNVYQNTFDQMRSLPVPRDVSGIDAVVKGMQAKRTAPYPQMSADEAKKARDQIEQLKASGQVTAQKATQLEQCVQLSSAAAAAAPAASPAKEKKKETKEPKAAPPATALNAQQIKLLDDCVQVLDPLRSASATQAMDIDRLRLWRDYAKDAHEHRQAFRSFWLQAAQLVLLNLLLPVLTALLGYIFGSQTASRKEP